jgi:hypothetical protein
MTPNAELTRCYGTEHVLEEKTAGEIPLVARLSAALLSASAGHAVVKSQAEQRDEADLLNLAAEELEKSRLRPATSALRHTRSPGIIGRGQGFIDPSLVPLGMDEGMVRLASMADRSGRALTKIAGIGTVMAAGAGKLLEKGVQAVPGLGGIKGSLALGAGVLGAGYLGTKAVRGGLKALGGEGRGAANYGAGNYQVPMGVNEYGHPQLGTQLA